MKPIAYSLIAALCLLATPARGDDRSGRAASTEVLVSGGSGQVEVLLHPSIITSLFLPEPIKRVLASDQKNFTVREMGNAVAIKPLVADPKLTANVVITTETMTLTVILRITNDPREAQGQVTFKRAEVEQELQTRIDAEVEKRLAASQAAMKKQIEQAVAERVFQRFESGTLRAVERNDDHVIVRVPRRVRVGADAYLFFRIQNRSDAVYKLARVEVVAAGHDLAGAVVFDGKTARGPVLGEIPPGGSADALVVVRDVDRIKTPAADLTVSEAGGRRQVRISGVEVR